MQLGPKSYRQRLKVSYSMLVLYQDRFCQLVYRL